MHGLAVSTTFSLTWCRNGGGSSCFSVGSVSADANGDINTTVDMTTSGLPAAHDYSGVFYLQLPASGGKAPIAYIMGLKVS
jgi:hypothetical protein